MASFNFDSESNITSNKIPSVKAINKLFCGSRNAAGLWIADDNMISCGWKKNCTESCDESCTSHFISTKEHIVQAATEEIFGRGIIDPRICVIRRSKLLRLTVDKGAYAGLWVKGDGELKNENGSKKYNCARRYLIIFLDKDNKPLHENPIQLTAKGNFQMSFDNSLMSFRDEFRQSYFKHMKRRPGKMNEEWYSMCVFAPSFESKIVGKHPTLTSQACMVSSYIVPTEINWLQLCVGRDPEVNEIIHLSFIESEEWIGRYEKNPSFKKKEETEDEDEE